MAQNKVQELLNGNSLFTTLIFLLVGIILLACGHGSIGLAFLLSGIIYIVIGIVEIAMKSVDIKGGIITIAIGAILVVISRFSNITDICAGIILLLSAVPVLFGAGSGIAEKLGISGVDAGDALVNKIIAVVLLVVGVLLIVSVAGFHFGDSTVDLLIRVGGAILVIVGVINLVKALKS